MTAFNTFLSHSHQYWIIVLDAALAVALTSVQVNYLTGRVDQSTAAFFAY